MSSYDSITALDASALSDQIHRRQVSCLDVMHSYLERIARLNPLHNAIINMASTESLLSQARQCDEELSRGHSRGWMHGMPQAIKDTGDAMGFPSTRGSAVLKSTLPTRDSIMVARMKAAGCIVIGKTNMPELGLGSHTFNTVFGPTRNAWDPQVSAGGSSGGGAVSLALRMLPVADGSDFMGSLRNPASWNHLFGLRPAQGRVPAGPGPDVWLDQLSTDGPMARSVRDLARLLSTQAGHDPRQPLSISTPWTEAPITSGTDALQGLRIGWLGDLNGHLALEDGIEDVCLQALQVMQSHGTQVQHIPLGFDPNVLWNCWLVWRRALVGPKVAALLEHPGAIDLVKPEALWEYENSLKLSAMDFMRASQTRTAYYHHLLKLFERYDVLALPATQVWPFPVEARWPEQINGRAMDTYHRWMECTLYATLGGLPAISMPAGFHREHPWPMGIQLIGPPQGEAKLIHVAAAYEASRREWIEQAPPSA